MGDLTMHSGKLLHEGAPVVRGIRSVDSTDELCATSFVHWRILHAQTYERHAHTHRYIVVGFVDVTAASLDHEFLASKMANASKRGAEIDYACATKVYLPTAVPVAPPEPR